MKDLASLTAAVLRFDDLTARQIMKDALREGTDWSAVEPPTKATAFELVVAAALAEMLAARFGSPSPAWTSNVGGSPEHVYLDDLAGRSGKLRDLLRTRS